ncbi:hypothetical protein [Methylobacterium sp. WSM2598]|uniref:hypothetical protein n=1 Tax=Methylobacterium sp. WSM2598 TaxID=398261 RepID=UPI000377E589|nr:hypothetical protein [Methylobacterium sp. WSM2598]
MDAADTVELDDDIEPQQELSPPVTQALAALREQKKHAATLLAALHAVFAGIEATQAFIEDQVYRFSVNGDELRAALIATGFVQPKGLKKEQRLANQVQCTFSQDRLRLTTHSKTLFCTTEIPLAFAPGALIEEGLSFRLLYAKMRDAFAHPKHPITFASTLMLGFHPIEQYLAVYLETGEIPLATAAASPMDEPWSTETFSPPHRIRPDVLVQGLQAIFISLGRHDKDPRYQVVEVSGGRMRAAAQDTCSVYTHPALEGLSLTLHAGDAFQLADVLQRFRSENTTLSSSDNWHRLEDGTLTLLIRRPGHPIVSRIDRTIMEADEDALARVSADRERLWQILTPFLYFLRIRQDERLGSISFPDLQHDPGRKGEKVELILSAKSRFESEVEPKQRMLVVPSVCLLDSQAQSAASTPWLVDFVHLERLIRWSRRDRLDLHLSDGGLLVTDGGEDWEVRSLLLTHQL